MAVGYSVTHRNTRLDALTTAVGNAGKLAIYDGTRPATGGTATTKLAEYTLGSPFAGAAAAAVLSPTLPANTTGLAAGTGTWGRLTTSGGTFIADYSVGTAVTDIVFGSVIFSIGGTVSLTAWTITEGNP